MRLSDIEGLVRSHLIEGETLTEQPSNYFDDRMYSIITAGAPAYVYTITAENLYGIGTLDALEVWRPDEDIAGRAIDAVLGYARRNGQPAPPPDPEEIFADLIAYLRPLLQEGESLSTGGGRNGEATLTIATQVGGGTIYWINGLFRYSSPLEPGYNNFADNKAGSEDLARRALIEARTPIDWDRLRSSNR